MISSDFMFLSGIAKDSDGIHSGESEQGKTAVLSTLSSGGAAGFGNGSSSKPWICDYLGGDDFEKGSNPIDDSVLDRIHPGLTGVQTCTAVNSLFFSSRQFLNREYDSCICLCVPVVQMSAASTSHDLILTLARHSRVYSCVPNES
eukprot:SAG31_NODE_2660_length_5284_cov_14.800000_3_plen_146_part_00